MANVDFKLTEVGLIPDDWIIKNVGDISDVRTGPFGSSLHERDYVSNGTPIITVEHLGERCVNHDNLPMVSDLDRNRLLSYSLNAGDIVFSRVGSVDRNALVRDAEKGWLFSGRLLRVRLKGGGKNDPSYTSYQFHSEAFKQRVRDVAVGQTMASINTKILLGIKIVMPPTLAEQQAIAEALSDADALIEALEQLIAKKRQIKQGAMQELLTGKRRLPGFSGEWDEINLGQLGLCYRGVSYNPITDLETTDTDQTIRLLRSNNVQNSFIVLNDIQYVISRRVSEHQILQKNDILICMANGSKDLVGKAAKYKSDQEYKYTFGAFMGCFRPNDQKIDSNYAFYIFNTEMYRSYISVLLAGSSINNLSSSNLLALKVKIPVEKAEQVAISSILKDTDDEIQILDVKLNKVRQLKQGMMQELLTGRIRLAQD